MLKRVIALVLFIFACSNSLEPGVVAIINGEKIYLEDLERQHDFKYLEYMDNFKSLENIKKEYKKELIDLFFCKLVEEELKQKNLDISEAELKKEEDKIRSDYPPGEFKKVLIEEYIDINNWRNFLKTSMQVKRFIDLVVKPEIKINAKELEDYYQNNLEDFYIPEVINFISFYSQDKNILIKIKNSRKHLTDIKEIKEQYPEAVIKEYNLAINQIPQFWIDMIKSTPEKQFSGIKNDKKGFYLLMVNKKEPAKYLKPIEAYPLIERNILNKKINEYIQKWFISKLKQSDIKINPSLLEEK